MMIFVALAMLCGACVSTTDAPDLEGSGPPEIQPDIVRRHADEFAGDLADRAPGSQGEQAASFYILGHLQQAGYVVRLDGVPVGNLVSSTNLMALPPSGDDPEAVVAVPYDTGGNLAIGVFLELARALHATEPEHAVEFVAMGAEGGGGEADQLGSRRLIKVLSDEEIDPVVITLSVFKAGVGDVFVDGTGPIAAGLRRTARRLGLREPTEVPPPSPHDDTVFARAGFDHVIVYGRPVEVGGTLLEYLASAGD